MPASLRGEIGQRMLQDLTPFTGTACTGTSGIAALATLRQRVLGAQSWSVVVVPDGPSLSAHLPGRLIVLRRDAIEDQPGPELAAGLLLAEAARARAHDPMQELMDDAGLPSTFSLLTRGEVSDPVLQAYAETYLLRAPGDLSDDELLAQFAAAGLSVAPYARAQTAARAEDLLARDPFPGGSPAPLLTDAAWLRLRGICES
jgi:hypothetical protein